MKLNLEINNIKYKIDLSHSYDISIPLKFNQAQPNTYQVDLASAEPYRAGDFIGDTRLGGSCNFEKLILVPHCNGTHTECIGHIINERIYIRDVLSQSFIISYLVSVNLTSGKLINESYSQNFEEGDLVITKEELEKVLLDQNLQNVDALIIRTIPNIEEKKVMDYSKNEAPFFSNDAIRYLKDLGIKHLLVDFPSLDRTYDNGKLSNHHIFWNVEANARTKNIDSYHLDTITEFIFVDNKIKDGKYLLNLQIAPFESDASPSRPIIFEINE